MTGSGTYMYPPTNSLLSIQTQVSDFGLPQQNSGGSSYDSTDVVVGSQSWGASVLNPMRFLREKTEPKKKADTVETRNKALEDEVEKVRKTLTAQFEKDKRSWTAERRKLETRISTLQRSIGNLQRSQKETDHQRASQITRLTEDVSRLQSESRKQEDAYNDRIKQLERENARQEGSIYGAQTAAKAMMEQNKSFAESDSEVKAWFTGKEEAWYGWAKDFAHKEPSRLENLPAEAWDEFSRFVVLGGKALPLELKGEKRTPYILLHGMLANFICDTAFSSPWWIFDANPELTPNFRKLLQPRWGDEAVEMTEATGDEENVGQEVKTGIDDKVMEILANLQITRLQMDTLYDVLKNGKQP